MSGAEERLRALLAAEAARHRPDRRRVYTRLLARIRTVQSPAIPEEFAGLSGRGRKAPKILGIAATFRGRQGD